MWMMTKSSGVFLALLFLSVWISFEVTADRPFPQHTQYHEGVIKPSVGQSQLDDEVLEFYKLWKQRYLKNVPNTNPVQTYVFYNLESEQDPPSAVSVSEGHGYGMLITAIMGDQSEFDALYRFYRAHPSVNNEDLMAWQQITQNGKIIDNPDGGDDSATDGDLDIGYALLLAYLQWGNEGKIDYLTAAIKSIRATMESVVNQREWILKLGDWADDDDSKYGKGTRSSDFMLSHMLTFARVDPTYALEWNHVYNKTVSIINHIFTTITKNTGLLPDFLKSDGSTYQPAPANYLEGKHDGDYDYNSCRTPWRLPISYILEGKTDILPQLKKLNEFFRTTTDGNPDRIRAGYSLKTGQPYVSYSDLVFVAPLAVSAMIDSSNRSWLDALWWSLLNDFPIKENDYYGNTVKMLVLITVSGNWWSP